MNLDGKLPGDGDDKASILIVDDLPEKLLVFQTVLEPLGQNLVYVRSGAEALREVLQREFAVILLDVNMPDIDGFETATMVRRYKRSAHTPIIFITAYADEMQTAQGYKLGAVDYIQSPVVPEVLRTKVRVFVDLHISQKRVERQADVRVALSVAEAARHAAEENTRRSEFLSRASRVMAASLEVSVGAVKLLELLVPAMASHATLLLLDDRQAFDQALGCDAVQPGETPRFTERAFAALPDAEQRALAGAIDARAAQQVACGLAVPLFVAERALGALLVSGSDYAFDLALLEELASRAAIAFENGRLYRAVQNEIVVRRDAETQLQAMNRRKDEFLAMLSHELRNPLAPIRNAVEVIRRVAPPDPKLDWATDVTERQINHLTRLVEELLDVARISQGKIALQIEPIDLLGVIAQGVETVRPFIDEKRHHLVQKLPDGPVWLRGDSARLAQVVSNLLHNAAKFSDEGGRLALALTVQQGQVCISVRDDGIGIEPELLPQVFELFEQGKRSLDRSQGGLGIGLTLVQRIVHLHNGRVEVSSAGHGQGAEFKVILPCLSEVKPADEPAMPPTPAPVGGCRVLVVDDNRDAAESIAMFLEITGHEVKTVGDGMQALASAPVYAPDVVVLDIGLPMLDGYEVARRMRKLPETSGSLLIAMTGYGQRSDKQLAQEAGFDQHLVKPADPDLLVTMIEDWRASGRSARPRAGRSARK